MPSAALTTGGPPGKTCPVPLDMTLKWARGGRGAAPPAAGPSTTDTTGARLSWFETLSEYSGPSGM